MIKEQFLQKLSTVKYATFDMDGTIIQPGLLIYDVMSNLFQQKHDSHKIKDLKKIY